MLLSFQGCNFSIYVWEKYWLNLQFLHQSRWYVFQVHLLFGTQIPPKSTFCSSQVLSFLLLFIQQIHFHILHSMFDDEIYWLKHLVLIYRFASIFEVSEVRWTGVLQEAFRFLFCGSLHFFYYSIYFRMNCSFHIYSALTSEWSFLLFAE